MHYIRLLRPPSLTDSRGGTTLNLVLTINTDLSDAEFCPDKPVKVSVFVDLNNGNGKQTLVDLSDRIVGAKSTCVWRAGMRVLKLNLGVPRQILQEVSRLGGSASLCIAATDHLRSSSDVEAIPYDEHGHIMPIIAQMPLPASGPSHISIRRLEVFDYTYGDTFLEIEEDLGESMARHVWDGGVVAVSMLAGLCAPLHRFPRQSEVNMPLLKEMFVYKRKPMNIVELGCGVGTFGLGTATILHMHPWLSEGQDYILLTDLEDAEERAMSNVRRLQKFMASRPSFGQVRLGFKSLDWEAGLREDGDVARTPWDLVIVSDCTYNVDSIPSLVKTLSTIHQRCVNGNGSDDLNTTSNPYVLLATKPRHSSEELAWRLIAAAGWRVLESVTLPLPHSAAEPQTVEIYLFGKDQKRDDTSTGEQQADDTLERAAR